MHQLIKNKVFNYLNSLGFEDQIVFTKISEKKKGLLFCYNTKGFVDSNDISFSLVGNHPIYYDFASKKYYYVHQPFETFNIDSENAITDL